MLVRLSPTASGSLLGLIGVTIFAATLPMTRIALQGYDFGFIVLARAALASAVAALALVFLRVPVPRGDLPTLFVVGVLLVFGFPGFSTLAMTRVPAAHGAVVLGIMPLLTASFAALTAGERPSLAFWGWSVLGAALVTAFTLGGADIQPGWGDLWLLAAGVSATLGYALSGALARRLPGWAVIAWALVLTAPLSVAGTCWQIAQGTDPLGAAPGPMMALAYLGLGSMFAGFVFWNAGLAIGGIARVSQVQLLQTFLTLAFAALLAGEKVTPTMVGFAVAVGVVVWMGRKARITRPAD